LKPTCFSGCTHQLALDELSQRARRSLPILAY
jgi:hypothetical protein